MIIDKLDYKYLIDDEKKKLRIKNRFKQYYERAYEFIKQKNLEGKVGVNDEILRVLILDYFTDIQRLKDFNPDLKRINLHKIYAYTSYWWLRRKPLQILDNNLDDETLVYINEEFISWFLLHEMNETNKEKNNLIHISMKNEIEKNFLQTLKYYLVYRLRSPFELELMLNTFDFSLQLYSRDRT